MDLKHRRDEARRASAIYDEKILPTLDEEADKGRFVFMDLDSGDYEVGGYDMEAIHDLLERRPDASLSMRRVGYETPPIIDDPLGKLIGASLMTGSQIRKAKGNPGKTRHGDNRKETRNGGNYLIRKRYCPC